MSYQLANAKVWDGSAWVEAVGGGGGPWFKSLDGPALHEATVTATADVSAHTKGAWAEVVASTSGQVTAVALSVGGVGASGVNTATLLDIGVGASGSEQVVTANVGVGGASTANNQRDAFSFLLPVSIAAGSRVSVRIQSVVTGGKTADVRCILFGWGDASQVPSSLDVLAADAATSQAASLSGASGTFSQIVASTSQAYSAIAMVPSVHNSVIGGFAGVLEVAVGSAGNETIFGKLETSYFVQELVTTTSSGYPPIFAYDIPASSRLSVRHNINSNPDRYGITLIGVP